MGEGKWSGKGSGKGKWEGKGREGECGGMWGSRLKFPTLQLYVQLVDGFL